MYSFWFSEGQNIRDAVRKKPEDDQRKPWNSDIVIDLFCGSAGLNATEVGIAILGWGRVTATPNQREVYILKIGPGNSRHTADAAAGSRPPFHDQIRRKRREQCERASDGGRLREFQGLTVLVEEFCFVLPEKIPFAQNPRVEAACANRGCYDDYCRYRFQRYCDSRALPVKIAVEGRSISAILQLNGSPAMSKVKTGENSELFQGPRFTAPPFVPPSPALRVVNPVSGPRPVPAISVAAPPRGTNAAHPILAPAYPRKTGRKRQKAPGPAPRKRGQRRRDGQDGAGARTRGGDGACARAADKVHSRCWSSRLRSIPFPVPRPPPASTPAQVRAFPPSGDAAQAAPQPVSGWTRQTCAADLEGPAQESERVSRRPLARSADDASREKRARVASLFSNSGGGMGAHTVAGLARSDEFVAHRRRTAHSVSSCARSSRPRGRRGSHRGEREDSTRKGGTCDVGCSGGTTARKGNVDALEYTEGGSGGSFHIRVSGFLVQQSGCARMSESDARQEGRRANSNHRLQVILPAPLDSENIQDE
ncbi:hypothetical protein DFH07DRAFT_944281 [Mycena maculata]|uniref:Uncharacterized protein n=1 Tax=Mycena maculata TaxID=230809 RepID=A0AAD7I880_9AGAR|nr:hypothetical protein DFH07DRAFT_944281 [Mycena maculata]